MCMHVHTRRYTSTVGHSCICHANLSNNVNTQQRFLFSFRIYAFPLNVGSRSIECGFEQKEKEDGAFSLIRSMKHVWKLPTAIVLKAVVKSNKRQCDCCASTEIELGCRFQPMADESVLATIKTFRDVYAFQSRMVNTRPDKENNFLGTFWPKYLMSCYTHAYMCWFARTSEEWRRRLWY